MTLMEWIDGLDTDLELEFWSRSTHFLNNRELKQIMTDVSRGLSLTESHKRAGVLEKYPVDLFRTANLMVEKYPESCPDCLSFSDGE